MPNPRIAKSQIPKIELKYYFNTIDKSTNHAVIPHVCSTTTQYPKRLRSTQETLQRVLRPARRTSLQKQRNNSSQRQFNSNFHKQSSQRDPDPIHLFENHFQHQPRPPIAIPDPQAHPQQIRDPQKSPRIRRNRTRRSTLGHRQDKPQRFHVRISSVCGCPRFLLVALQCSHLWGRSRLSIQKRSTHNAPRFRIHCHQLGHTTRDRQRWLLLPRLSIQQRPVAPHAHGRSQPRKPRRSMGRMRPRQHPALLREGLL